jgi:hypothetical protein
MLHQQAVSRKQDNAENIMPKNQLSRFDPSQRVFDEHDTDCQQESTQNH